MLCRLPKHFYSYFVLMGTLLATGCGTRITNLAALIASQGNGNGGAITLAQTQEVLESSALAGWDFIDLKFVLAKPGKVHYVVYDTAPGTPPTALQIKNAVVGGTLISVGTVDIPTADTEVTEAVVATIAESTSYTIYSVAEDDDGTLLGDATIETTTVTTAQRFRPITYVSAVATADTTVSTTVGYYQYLPREFFKDPSKKLPVLFFAHGYGERASAFDVPNLSLILIHGPPKLIQAGTWDETLPFIVIAPQMWRRSSPEWRNEGKSYADEVLARLSADYPGRVDVDRVYLTGLSWGGNFTYSYISDVTRNSRIAAAVPVAGWYGAGGDMTADPATANIPCTTKDVPIWSFHGDADGTVTIASSRRVVTRLNSTVTCGAPAPSVPVKLTEFPGVGHDSWTRTYNDTHGDTNVGADAVVYGDIYNWLLSFRRFIATPDFDSARNESRVRYSVNTPLAGTYYVAIYSSNQGALSNAAVMSAAASSPGGSLVHGGVHVVSSGQTNANYTVRESGLPVAGNLYIYKVFRYADATEFAEQATLVP